MGRLRQLCFDWSQPFVAPKSEVTPKDAAIAAASIVSQEERSRGDVEQRLKAFLGHPVTLVITDNRRSVIRMMRKDGSYVLRLHHMFLRAPDSILADLATFLRRSNRNANARLDRFIDEHHDQIRKGVSRNVKLRALGRTHDLKAIFDDLNERYFDGSVRARVTWGRAPAKKRRRRSIRLGTYSADESLIRIHPSLDADWVPEYVVTLVMYHEMLHAVIPPVVRGSHKVFHTPEFRRRERAHPDYDKAAQWEHRNLLRLLRS